MPTQFPGQFPPAEASAVLHGVLRGWSFLRSLRAEMRGAFREREAREGLFSALLWLRCFRGCSFGSPLSSLLVQFLSLVSRLLSLSALWNLALHPAFSSPSATSTPSWLASCGRLGCAKETMKRRRAPSDDDTAKAEGSLLASLAFCPANPCGGGRPTPQRRRRLDEAFAAAALAPACWPSSSAWLVSLPFARPLQIPLCFCSTLL